MELWQSYRVWCYRSSPMSPLQLIVTRHASHVTRYTSRVTRHASHVTRHTSHATRRERKLALMFLSLTACAAVWTRTQVQVAHHQNVRCAIKFLAPAAHEPSHDKCCCRMHYTGIFLKTPCAHKNQRELQRGRTMGNKQERYG